MDGLTHFWATYPIFNLNHHWPRWHLKVRSVENVENVGNVDSGHPRFPVPKPLLELQQLTIHPGPKPFKMNLKIWKQCTLKILHSLHDFHAYIWVPHQGAHCRCIPQLCSQLGKKPILRQSKDLCVGTMTHRTGHSRTLKSNEIRTKREGILNFGRLVDWHIHTHLDAPRWDEVVDLRDSQSSSVWILDIKATPVLLCSIYLTSLNSLINNNRLCFAVLPRKKCFFFEDSTCGDPLRGVLQIFQVSAPRETDFVRFGFWEDLRMVLTLKKSAKQQVLLLLLSLVHLVSGVISPNWSKVRQASQMKNLGNKCVEKTELANINDWESKFRASNPVRSWCFCHETSKSFDDVGGASIRLPCSLWKRQIPEEWTPFSRRLFVPVHTQKGSGWNCEWRVKDSQRLPLHTPYQHWPVLLCSVCVMWCDFQTP